jgi:ethanolamine-phosphate phospho-lyase
VIESEQLQAKATEVGGYLKSKFLKLQERLDLIGDIRGAGFFVGIEFVRDRKSLEPATEETSFICTKLKEKHSILTSIDGPHDNVLVIKPPMVFSKADVDEFVGCFEKVVLEDLAQVEDIMSMAKTPT